MLLNNDAVLEQLLQLKTVPIVVHSEDESIIKANTEKMTAIYGENIPIEKHPEIRSEEACLLSSEKIIKLARQYHSKCIFCILVQIDWRYFQKHTLISAEKYV